MNKSLDAAQIQRKSDNPVNELNEQKNARFSWRERGMNLDAAEKLRKF
jgi:hypothetical protein